MPPLARSKPGTCTWDLSAFLVATWWSLLSCGGCTCAIVDCMAIARALIQKTLRRSMAGYMMAERSFCWIPAAIVCRFGQLPNRFWQAHSLLSAKCRRRQPKHHLKEYLSYRSINGDSRVILGAELGFCIGISVW